MRKYLFILFVFTLLLTGCASNKSGTIEIKDKMFLTQTNEIYENYKDYLGKNIKLEGIYTQEGKYQTVYRKTNGCCGDDGKIGFGILWDGAKAKADDWVEVEGVLEEYKDNGGVYLVIKANELNVLPERGIDFVTQ